MASIAPQSVPGRSSTPSSSWTAAAWVSDKVVVTSSSSNGLLRWDGDEGVPFAGGEHRSVIFAIRPITAGDHQRVLTVSMDRQIGEWDVQTTPPKLCAWGTSAVAGFVTAIVVLPGGSLVAVCIGDGSVRILQRGTADEKSVAPAGPQRFCTTATLTVRKQAITSLYLPPRSDIRSENVTLAAGTKSGRLLFIEVSPETGEVTRTTLSPDKHGCPVVGIVGARFVDDSWGNRLYSWGTNGRLIEWKVPEPTPSSGANILHERFFPHWSVDFIRWSSKGAMIARRAHGAKEVRRQKNERQPVLAIGGLTG